MADDPADRLSRSIPQGRLSRLGQFGRLVGGVAGGMMAECARRLAAGERPRMSDLVLTLGNAKRLADRLSHLRGAAMKLGQMISMDAGARADYPQTGLGIRGRIMACGTSHDRTSDIRLSTELGAVATPA